MVNVGDLGFFKANTEVDCQRLREDGFLSKGARGLKILGNGELNIPLTVKATRFSASAKEKIEKAGGQAIIV